MDKNYNIIVAAIPRTGSTLVARSFAHLSHDSSCWDYNKENGVYKTHKLEPYIDTNCKKAIFTFGDVTLSILSMLERRWDKYAFRNCGYVGPVKECNMINRDDLNFETIFDTWTNPTKHIVLAIRYRAIASYISEIEDFVGYSAKWPSFKNRKNKIQDYDSKLVKQIQ